MTKQLPDIIKEICSKYPRYDPAAYYFIYEALDYTLRKTSVKGHITGQQLLEGVRLLAIERFGMLAKSVFNQWGVLRTEDFGEIVFQLVEHEAMGKTDSDSRDDFKDGYDFDSAFQDPVELGKEWKIPE